MQKASNTGRSQERVGIVEKVMNDGSIGSTFNEGHLTVEGEDAY
ncbi:putative collagen-binding surface domain protein, partial [Clostridioides difficile DA00210]